MNKKGFTLQELLITMLMIGVVAAVTAPAITGLFPDENKMKYMKAYNTLTNITGEIINDLSLYWDVYDDTTSELEESGFYSSAKPQVPPYNNDDHCQSASKYPAIFSKFVNIQGEVSYSNNAALGSTVEFTTNDGVLWNFDVAEVNGEYPGGLGYQTTLTINVNPKDEREEHNCVFDNSACKKPNQYAFRIENDGSVYPADALGMAYLINSSNMNSANEDREVAAEIVTAAGDAKDFDKLQTAFNTVTSKKKNTTTN